MRLQDEAGPLRGGGLPCQLQAGAQPFPERAGGGGGHRQEEGLAQTEALRGRDLAISGSRRKTQEVGQGAREKLAGHGQPADGVWFDFHR